MQWTTALMAEGTATIGVAAKCLVARAEPKPEFCMPTSTEMVRRTNSSNPRSRGSQ
jgi:hypothetical protein